MGPLCEASFMRTRDGGVAASRASAMVISFSRTRDGGEVDRLMLVVVRRDVRGVLRALLACGF